MLIRNALPTVHSPIITTPVIAVCPHAIPVIAVCPHAIPVIAGPVLAIPVIAVWPTLPRLLPAMSLLSASVWLSSCDSGAGRTAEMDGDRWCRHTTGRRLGRTMWRGGRERGRERERETLVSGNVMHLQLVALTDLTVCRFTEQRQKMAF